MLQWRRAQLLETTGTHLPWTRVGSRGGEVVVSLFRRTLCKRTVCVSVEVWTTGRPELRERVKCGLPGEVLLPSTEQSPVCANRSSEEPPNPQEGESSREYSFAILRVLKPGYNYITL